jgi:type II secretory ATPase GspE/PulE/Tfp pilus assembly ATPase PilB-like protein
MKYEMRYGPEYRTASTLKEAREIAKALSRRTIYEITIVANGDVIETLVPRVSKSGRFTFRTRKAH